MNTIDVVIIEDNLKVAKAHQLYVEKIPGFSVTGIVNSLDDAPAMIRALEPDLILLDIYFPDGNGMDLLDQLRSEHLDCDVILITAAKDVRLLHNALRGGVFDYMIKPVFFERFQEALGQYRNHWEKLKQIERMDQDEVDQFFQHQLSMPPKKEQEHPKGIDPITLGKVVTIFDADPETGFNAAEIGTEIGSSRTTARKYLEYLIATGFLKIELEYGTIGRPERRYVKA